MKSLPDVYEQVPNKRGTGQRAGKRSSEYLANDFLDYLNLPVEKFIHRKIKKIMKRVREPPSTLMISGGYNSITSTMKD